MTSKLKEEAMVLYNLRHTNIVPFSGVLWSPPDFGIAMPLMPYGSFNKFLNKYEVSWMAKVTIVLIQFVAQFNSNSAN